VLERDMLAPHGLARWAAIDPDQIALEHVDGQSLTYAELDHDGRTWASALQRIGVGVGTHVATLLPNIFDAHRTMLGLAWLRAVEVPLNTGYTGRMLEYTLEYSDTEVLVTTSTFLDQVEQIAPRLPALRTVVVVEEAQSASRPLASGTDRVEILSRDDFLTGCAPAVDLPGPEVWDIACLLFTSGTTGPSKAVINPWGLVVQMCSWFPEDTLAPRDGLYSAMPLFHNSGRSQFNYVVTHGARFVIRDKFSATNVWDDVRKTNCTTLCLVGPLTSLLYAAPPRDDDATTPVRNVLLGPMIPDMEGFEKRFNVRVCTCYGQTEIGSPVATPWEHGPWANCGRTRTNWPFHEVRLVDEHDQPVPTGQTGEMIVRSPEPWSLNLGYYKMPEKTVEAWRNGWFHTGDVFKQDEDGWYYFVDRLNDAIRRRGENISSFEVENYVVSYDDVVDCTAIGVRTEHGDEEVMACVIVHDREKFEPAALIKYLEADMPRFMIPRYVQVLDDFPRNETTGRVRKNELRDQGVTDTTWDREAQA
jgi:carnitine-CoA ligase